MTNITFKSIAELRIELASQDTVSTIHLIKSFVEKIKNENAALVTYLFY